MCALEKLEQERWDLVAPVDTDDDLEFFEQAQLGGNQVLLSTIRAETAQGWRPRAETKRRA